ncbi:MAG: hypothetical protein GY803_12435, partial [Chloroflexi bacterium]|nr:hypothetical protein [Chloroflexota bacterium]
MIHHRTKSEVRRFDIMKLAVALALVAILIWQLLAGRGDDARTDAADTAVPAAETETEAAALDAEAGASADAGAEA